MEEKDYLRESRLIAIEHLLIHVYNLTGKILGASDEQLRKAEDDALAALQMNTVSRAEKLTPVQKDHLAAETTLSMQRLFEMARERR